MITHLTHKLIRHGYHTSLSIMALRVLTLGSKFLLTLFLARYLGLAELGTYGLVVGVVTVVPMFISLGMQNGLSRDMVGCSQQELIIKLKSYWKIMAAFYAILLLAVLGGSLLMPQLAVLAMLVFLVIVTEHVGQDIYNYYVSQHKQLVANIILFVKSAGWIFVYIAIALLWAESRTLTALLVFWLAGNVLPLLYFTYVTRGWPWLKTLAEKPNFKKIYATRYLFVSDVSLATGQYADRYLVTLFLGLEAAGIYVFFWQIGSAVLALVNTSILQIYKPRLIGAHKKQDNAAFSKHMKHAALSSLSTVSALALVAGMLMVVLLPYVKPELVPYEWLMWLILFGTFVRTLATLAGFTLYTRSRDKRYAAIAVSMSLGACLANAAVLAAGGGLMAVCLVNLAVLFLTLLLRWKS